MQTFKSVLGYVLGVLALLVLLAESCWSIGWPVTLVIVAIAVLFAAVHALLDRFVFGRTNERREQCK